MRQHQSTQFQPRHSDLQRDRIEDPQHGPNARRRSSRSIIALGVAAIAVALVGIDQSPTPQMISEATILDRPADVQRPMRASLLDDLMELLEEIIGAGTDDGNDGTSNG